jgi:aryl-alcohol dehydrogenase-like predicted oxidoreductase
MKRPLAGRRVNPVGLGCMGLSWGYGPALPDDEAVRLLHRALDLGCDHFDTAALYGAGHNETLLARALGENRHKLLIASKVGLTAQSGGRAIDCRPEAITAACERSLRRLAVERIDLLYLHRLDREVPIEASMGAMAKLVADGKVGAVGLSEMSAATLRRAHAIHPVAAVQSEYSPFSRNVEISVLEACRELGAAFVAFSPLARGVLAGSLRDPTTLAPADVRRHMPRFSAGHWPANLHLAEMFAFLAGQAGMTPAQLCIAWVLSRGDHVLAIPGTTSLVHLEDTVSLRKFTLPYDLELQIDALINQGTVSGPRYPAAVQATIDTEEF